MRAIQFGFIVMRHTRAEPVGPFKTETHGKFHANRETADEFAQSLAKDAKPGLEFFSIHDARQPVDVPDFKPTGGYPLKSGGDNAG